MSVAAALVVEGGTIREARLGLAGVTPTPWRARETERSLIGSAPTPEAVERAAALALAGARGRAHNEYKLRLAKRAVVRTLATVTA